MRARKSARRRYRRIERGPDDALTNPLYSVRVLPSGKLDHRRAARAADEAAKQYAERHGRAAV